MHPWRPQNPAGQGTVQPNVADAAFMYGRIRLIDL